MIVTINTDASYHDKYKVGAFAFWIVCDLGRISQSGVLRKRISRPEIAEFQCIINALHVLGSQKFPGIRKIIVNTDCLNVIHLVTNNKLAIQRYGLASWGRHLVTMYNLTLIKHKLLKTNIEFRHINSHQGTETKKQWVNDWCDKAAKKALWDLIKRESPLK